MILLAVFFSKIAYLDIPIKRDGITIFKQGVFYDGCYYGKDESLSDHPPVIYKDLGLGTWNISSPISHYFITDKNKVKGFYGHKFFTDDDGNLINREKRIITLPFTTEVALFSQSVLKDKEGDVTGKYGRGYSVVIPKYTERIEKIFNNIKKMMDDYDIDYWPIQEIPQYDQENIDGENIHDIFKTFFQGTGKNKVKDPKFFISFSSPESIAKKKGKQKVERPDVALISKADAVSLTVMPADSDNRLQPYCDTKNKTKCVIAAHIKKASNDAELIEKCKAIESLGSTYLKAGFKEIDVIGDYNANADKISKVCKDVPGFQKALIFTSKSKKNSCYDNEGHHNPNNIDLLIRFGEPLAKPIKPGCPPCKCPPCKK